MGTYLNPGNSGFSRIRNGATLVNAAEAAGNKFIMIIDEWDAPIRETPEIQRMYLEFLRTLFKKQRNHRQDLCCGLYDGYTAHQEGWIAVCRF